MEKFSEKRFVVYLNDKNEIPDDIKKFNKESNGFFLFININCKEASNSFCENTFKVTEIPSLMLYKDTFKSVQTRLEKQGLSLPLEYKSLITEIYKHFNSGLKEGNPQTFTSLNNEARLNKKIPFVYFHEGDIPLALHLLSSEEKYTKYIDFVVFENPPPQLMRNFKLNKLPIMVILILEINSDQ
jgi:hypothetical protein